MLVVDLARRNLFQDKLRFAISAGGVALAITLILVLNGMFVGMNRQISAYLDNTPVELVVSQAKIKTFLGANSRIPLSVVSEVAKVAGVEKAIPVFSSYAVLDLGGRREFSLLTGFDKKKGGGPWRVTEGTADIQDDEVVMDKLVAERHDLKLGDNVRILGRELTITGLSTGTSSWMTGTFFVTLDTASRMLASPGTTAFILVKAKNPDEIGELKDALAGEFPFLAVTTKEERAANDVALYAGVFSKPLLFMVVIAFLIGVMLVATTIYTATVERAREYGALKAIGAPNARLYRVVFEQALIASFFGFVGGIALTYVAIFVIGLVAPQFFILVEAVYVSQVFAVAVLISLTASYVPIRAVARIDPAIAFKRGA